MAKKSVTRYDPNTGKPYTTTEGTDEDVLTKDKVTDVAGLAEAARKAREKKANPRATPTAEPEDDPNDMSLAAVARRKKKKQLSTESQLKALAK